MLLSEPQLALFLTTVWEYYARHARNDLPWRRPEEDGTFEPYKILVSELMLQQTQVSRVVPKYEAFIQKFPTAATLASAELGDVLRAWQGLGYNRRAKYLWLSAKHICVKGWPDDLTLLPGVGTNTAGAVQAYAFNRPAIFVETNIRTLYLYHFADGQATVPDSRIREWLQATLDRERPREFYWALMDYGSFLKTQVRNLSQSKHYKRQSAFEGSRRQLRGFVVRELSGQPATLDSLQSKANDMRMASVMEELLREGLIIREGSFYCLSS